MPLIIDILAPKYSKCPHFTVDTHTGAVSVAVTTPADAVLYVSGVADLIGKFQKRDNINLISAGFYIPECFTQGNTAKADTVMALNELQIIIAKSNLALAGPLPGLGPRGVIALPWSNYEIGFDLFSDMSAVSLLTDNFFFLKAYLYPNNISMVGVPAALDTKVIKIIPFIKIAHTLPIIA